MDDLMLPSLPDSDQQGFSSCGYYATDLFTADQMREYAKKAVEAEVLKISEALRQVGLTLVTSKGGYRVMDLGQITAGPAR